MPAPIAQSQHFVQVNADNMASDVVTEFGIT